jgi:hypothetical protein
MPSIVQVDACGRRRSPATLSSFHQGRPPGNKGQRYPADPPTVEEIIAVMRSAGEDNEAVRLRGLIVVLGRAGLRHRRRRAIAPSTPATTGSVWGASIPTGDDGTERCPACPEQRASFAL